MARKPRIHFPGAFYHVMLRGNDKNQIFFSEEDREYFYFLMIDGIKKYNYRIHGFCLMSNHVHLAIQVGEISVSKAMHNLSFRYASYINKNNNKVGHIFQGRFKAILVDADNYLLTLIRYIHLNPVRANMVNDAEKYTWSSHRAYLGLEKNSWLTKEFVLNYFNESGEDSASQFNYFCKNLSAEEPLKEFQIGNHRDFAILAKDKFLENLEKNTVIVPKFHVALDDLVLLVSSYYSTEISLLQSPSKNRLLSKTRNMVAWLAREFDVCSLEDVAQHFNRDASGFSRSLRTWETSMRYKSELDDCRNLLNMSDCQA
jgi:putative transposase